MINSLSLNFFEVNIILDLQEAADRGSTNGAFVSLHPDDLGAVDAETHMSAWQHDGILVRRVAHNAFFLAFISQICSSIVNSVDVV